MGIEGITQNTKVWGNTRPKPPPLGECAIVLGRYAVLFSTAPPPLRLSALQNACVCPHSGRHMISLLTVPPRNDEWEPLGFPLLNYDYSMMITPFSVIVIPSPNSPLSYFLCSSLSSAMPCSLLLAPTKKSPPGR